MTTKPMCTHPILQFKPTRAEAGKLSRLMRRMDKLSEEYGNLTGLLHEECLEYFSKREPINAELDALAAEIGKRTLGELPLTLRTDWSEKTKQEPVVVLRIEVHYSKWDPQYSWMGEGFRLRKDGSVSLIESGIRLDNRHVWRRHLDGGWTSLASQAENIGRANKC